MAFMMSEENKEKYIAAFIGCALGDALGMPVEGWKPEQIRKYVGKVREFMDPVIVHDENGDEVTEDEFGKLKYYTRDFRKGQYTDDTILAVALAKSITRSGDLDLLYVAQDQAREYKERKREDGTVFGGFGRTTMAAFENVLQGALPKESGVIGGPGNGPAMKMFPVGLYMHFTGEYEAGLKFAEEVSKITHLDPRSIASGILQAHAVYAALEGLSRDEFLDSIVGVCKEWEEPVTEEFPLHKKGGLLSRLEWIDANRDVDSDVAHKKLGSSSVVYRSFPFSIFMAQKYWDAPAADVLEGMFDVVNYGGDCDTTGAMYGAIMGARHGAIWPEEMVQEIDNRRTLVGLGRSMNSLLGWEFMEKAPGEPWKNYLVSERS